MKQKIGLQDSWFLVIYLFTFSIIGWGWARSVTKDLHWRQDHNRCGGHFHWQAYKQPKDRKALLIKGQKTQWQVHQTNVCWSGRVVIRQGSRRLMTQQACFVRHKKRGWQRGLFSERLSYVDRLLRAVAYSGSWDVPQDQVNLEHVRYRLFGPQKKRHYWGRASLLRREHSGHYVAEHVTLTTCSPRRPVWQIAAHKIEFSMKSGWADAWNSVFSMGGVPLFYWPYLRFPIDNKRHTGFLYPQLVSAQGAYLGVPFYLNMAPNFDGLLTPFVPLRQLDKHGFGLGGRIRGLWQHSNVQLEGQLWFANGHWEEERAQALQGSLSVLQRKHLLASPKRMRYWWYWQQKAHWGKQVDLNINLRYVSDDALVFEHGLLDMATLGQTVVSSDIVGAWHDPHNAVQLGWALKHVLVPAGNYDLMYQTVYQRLPYIHWDLWGRYQGFKYRGMVQVDHFVQHDEALLLGADADAWRFVFLPELIGRHVNEWGHITGTFSLPMRGYRQLEPAQSALAVPQVNLDLKGRKNTFSSAGNKGQGWVWWPRLGYRFAPFSPQNTGANFDARMVDPQAFLFAPRRFVGFDRFADANEMSYALVLSHKAKSKAEKSWRGLVGQNVALVNHRVCLHADCADDLQAHYHFSPVYLQAHWSFAKGWLWDNSFSYVMQLGQVNDLFTSLGYKKNDNAMILGYYRYNLHSGYRFQLGQAVSQDRPQSQFGGKVNWSLGRDWWVFADIAAVQDQQTRLTYDVGVQYTSCCWQLKVHVQGFGKIATEKTLKPHILLSLHLLGLGS
jgi:LPS-assembly protein